MTTEMTLALIAGFVAAVAVFLSIRTSAAMTIERQTVELLNAQLAAERERAKRLEIKVSELETTISIMRSQLDSSHREYLQLLEKIANK